jgi:hypothetical protein
MKNKFISKAFLLAVISLFLFACEEEGPNFKDYSTYYPEQSVAGMSPSSGYPGTDMIIDGKDFGGLIGAVKVFFGGIQADLVTSCTDNQIVVQVPAEAVSGKVSLQIWTHTLDSIGSYTVIPAPVISSVASSSVAGSNIALPRDTITIIGSGFGIDSSQLLIEISGVEATILTPVKDTEVKVIAPDEFATGDVTLTIGGLMLVGAPAMINPSAPGDITPYFFANTGTVIADDKGGGFVRGDAGTGRWGQLGEPWISNAAALNKDGVGGFAIEAWNGLPGYMNWETWGNTPVVDGIIYQPSTMPLPAGNYTVSFSYYSEIQTNSFAHILVAAGGNGIPVLADLETALGYGALYNGAEVGTTAPSEDGVTSFDFTLETSQVVSLGVLGNLEGRETKGNYFIIKWIKVVKN